MQNKNDKNERMVEKMNKLFGYYWEPNTLNVTVYDEETAKRLERGRNITWIACPTLEDVVAELESIGCIVLKKERG